LFFLHATPLDQFLAVAMADAELPKSRASRAHVEAKDVEEGKQNFDWIYTEETPVAYKTQILDARNYITDNSTRAEFDRMIKPKCDDLAKARGGKLNFLDLGSCFGNSTLGMVYGMPTEDLRSFWKDEKSCQKVTAERRFPCKTIAVDLSENALKYCKSSGLADETHCINLNDAQERQNFKDTLQSTDILFSGATLCYLTAEAVDDVIGTFARGKGDGYICVNFLNPFEPEKSDQMKQILLKHLKFVGSAARRHRLLTEVPEKKTYPDYGDWSLIEIWVLQRPGASGVLDKRSCGSEAANCVIA